MQLILCLATVDVVQDGVFQVLLRLATDFNLDLLGLTIVTREWWRVRVRRAGQRLGVQILKLSVDSLLRGAMQIIMTGRATRIQFTAEEVVLHRLLHLFLR